jgi:16S rRNA (guanine527-N7)-methyltransferase
MSENRQSQEMMSPEIVSFLSEGLEFMGLTLDNQGTALERLAFYFQELKKWNSKVNLVARPLSDEKILENHFLDSLTLLPLLPTEGQAQESVLDVGTGAGFPGLVLKTVCPALPVVLLEPRKNRYYFLKHIIRTLALQEVEVFALRLGAKTEEEKLTGRRFSFITSRAFTDMHEFVRLASPYLAREGRIACMKGPGAAREMENFARQAGDIFYVAEAKRLQLPFSKAERMLVIIKRSGQ